MPLLSPYQESKNAKGTDFVLFSYKASCKLYCMTGNTGRASGLNCSRKSFCLAYLILGALMLLVGRLEGHLACKKSAARITESSFLGGSDRRRINENQV